ncbi:MAG: hypothetical protein AAF687_14420 [Pseudomonadota bacterium]
MKHQTKIMLLLVGTIVATLAAGITLALIIPSNGPSASPILMFVFGVVVCGLALAAAVPWWNRLDELQRQGHTEGWYWGSMLGALPLLTWLIVSTGRHSDLSLGAIYLMLAQGIGFAIAFAFFRLRRSSLGPAE